MSIISSVNVFVTIRKEHLVGGSVGMMVGSLVGWLVGGSVGMLVGGSVGTMVGALVGRVVGRCFSWSNSGYLP